MTKRYTRLTDNQWEFIREFLPVQRKRRHDLRNIFDALLWITRTGSQWRNLDSQFPPWSAVYYYFYCWTKEGRFSWINEAMNIYERTLINRASRPSLGNIDSQSIKLAPMIYEDRGIDGNKKVNGRKRQIIVDILGRVWAAKVHSANQHDGVSSVSILTEVKERMHRIQKILGDYAYGGVFADACQNLSIEFEKPLREEGVKGFTLEAKRWIVERTFAWFNFFRRIGMDYEHTHQSAVSFIFLANISMILPKIAHNDAETTI